MRSDIAQDLRVPGVEARAVTLPAAGRLSIDWAEFEFRNYAEDERRIDSAVLDDFAPDLTLILDLDVKIGLERALARSGAETRFEKFGPEFHEKLRQAFLDIAKRNPERCRVIDASGSEDQVAEAIFATVSRRFDL